MSDCSFNVESTVHTLYIQFSIMAATCVLLSYQSLLLFFCVLRESCAPIYILWMQLLCGSVLVPPLPSQTSTTESMCLVDSMYVYICRLLVWFPCIKPSCRVYITVCLPSLPLPPGTQFLHRKEDLLRASVKWTLSYRVQWSVCLYMLETYSVHSGHFLALVCSSTSLATKHIY